MKRIFCAAFLTFTAISCYSQGTNVIDSLKKLEPFDYSERPAVKTSRDQFFQIDASKLLIVIDGKIYSAEASEYKNLKKTDIVSTKSIRDTQSQTGIEQILIITTRRKNRK